jgi:hypothetical protein
VTVSLRQKGEALDIEPLVDVSHQVCYYIFQSIFSLYSVYIQCEGFAKLTSGGRVAPARGVGAETAGGDERQ